MQVKKFDSINVVPFIDIMLVLLVIVLTTASFVAKGLIPVDLPQSKTASAQDDKKNLTITIRQNGDILFEKIIVSEEDVAKELSKYKVDTPVHINCDKEARFDLFVTLLDELEANEFRNLGIITRKDK